MVAVSIDTEGSAIAAPYYDQARASYYALSSPDLVTDLGVLQMRLPLTFLVDELGIVRHRFPYRQPGTFS